VPIDIIEQLFYNEINQSYNIYQVGGKMTSQSITQIDNSVLKRLSGIGIHRNTIFSMIIFIALLAFEIFNYSTTDYALKDLLGDLTFAGLSWASILSIAFCGIDFAGIARLFTPDSKSKEPTEGWYLFGAWILAATMNAILTWWAVSLALENHSLKSTSVISQDTLVIVVPIFVAIMVWLIRILIIGSLSLASDRFFGQPASGHSSGILKSYSPKPTTVRSPMATPTVINSTQASFQTAHRPGNQPFSSSSHQSTSLRVNESFPTSSEGNYSPVVSGSIRPDPVYQPLSTSSKYSGPTQKM
jgi:hypothetical protein